MRARCERVRRAAGVRGHRHRGARRAREMWGFVGRALRAAVGRWLMGGICITVDCDVLDADGGTRVASVTGGFVALYAALEALVERGVLSTNPVRAFVAAISVGLVDGEWHLDPDQALDSRAGFDLNLVMNDRSELVEVQGAAERATISNEQLHDALALGARGIERLLARRREGLGVR